MPDIYINTDRTIDRSIVAGITQPQREAPIGSLVAGSSYDTNLYFVKNDGTYDAASGAAGQSVKVAISTLGKTQSGTFTLTDGTDTTAAIEYGASAQTIEDALNDLNGATGLELGTTSKVDVVKVSDTQYALTFRAFGAQTALDGSTVSLYPESGVDGSVAVGGSSTQYAQQIIEIARQPAIYQATWTAITDGFNATLALNTTRLLQSLLIDKGEPFYIEVKLNDEVVAREVVGIEYSTMPASAFSETAIDSLLDTFAADPTSNSNFDAAAWKAALAIIAGDVDFGTGTDGYVWTSDGAGGAAWEAASGGGGSSTWGGITGTLSDQTDLQAALDAKQPLDSVLTNTTASFTTADETKLDGIEAGADVTDATNVNAAGAVMESDFNQAFSLLVQQSGTGSPATVNLSDNAILGRTTGGGASITGLSASDIRTLINVEDGATADQTGAEIKSLYEAEANAYTDAKDTKLSGIEASADVTDSANVVTAIDGATLTDAGTPAATDQILIKDAGTGALQTADFSEFGGGGGGGDVATDTIWDAKGDLAAGTGADTASRLPIGANDYVLTADSAEATGMKWAASTAGLSAATDLESVRKTSGVALQPNQIPLAGFGFDFISQDDFNVSDSTGSVTSAAIDGGRGWTYGCDAASAELIRATGFILSPSRYIDFDVAGGFAVSASSNSAPSTGSVTHRVILGKLYTVGYSITVADIGDLISKGIGLKFVNTAGTATAYLQTHDGTTLTNTLLTQSLDSNPSRFLVHWDGSGNAYVYHTDGNSDPILIGSNAAAPSGSGNNVNQFTVEAEADASFNSNGDLRISPITRF